jgi:hypothetical protein
MTMQSNSPEQQGNPVAPEVTALALSRVAVVLFVAAAASALTLPVPSPALRCALTVVFTLAGLLIARAARAHWVLPTRTRPFPQ